VDGRVERRGKKIKERKRRGGKRERGDIKREGYIYMYIYAQRQLYY